MGMGTLCPQHYPHTNVEITSPSENMKTTLILLALGLALAAAAPQFDSLEDGSSALNPYSFQWDLSEEDSEENKLRIGHKESRSEESDTTRGSYYTLLADGRLLEVEYIVTPEGGFQPILRYDGSLESLEVGDN